MTKSARLSLVILIIAVLVGGCLRFFNLNWDNYLTFHPDERNIASAVTKIDLPNQLDPGFHAYNGFFIYQTRLITQLLSSATRDSIWNYDWGHIALVARNLSAAYSTLSIILLFVFISFFLSFPWPAIAAALMALSPGLIQYAHYGVTESLLIFLSLLLAIISYKTFHHPLKLLNWCLLALISGLSLATKTSALSFLLIPFVVWLLAVSNHRNSKLILYGFYFLIITTITFFVFSPYTFLDFARFQESMKYEGGVVNGTLSVPYTLQFTNTTPYWFFFKNLFWQINPFITILGVLGLIFITIQCFKNEKYRPLLPFIAFSWAYLLYVGSWHTKFVRYYLPITPALFLGAVYALKRLKFKHKKLVFTFSTLTIIVCALWSAAYMHIFASPQTRTAATQWIYQNLPERSVILHEHWDDRVPHDLQNYPADMFEYKEQKVYDSDSPQKINTLLTDLSQGDYYIISSRRVYGSIINNPNIYPYTTHFYQLLFAQKLGYTLLNEFSSYPQIGNLIVNDDSSEETFQVYDHPHIYIFANTGRFPLSKLNELLLPQNPLTPQPQ